MSTIFLTCDFMHLYISVQKDKKKKVEIEQSTKSNVSKKTKHLFFQPADEVEFPTKEGPPRIPHILHQVLQDEYVIANYSKYIKSFIKHNPKWQYRFWTHESGRRLMAEKHPYLLNTFDSLPLKGVKKTDFVKYVVMYEYGGFYSDIDVMNLRPLDIVTTKYACIIPPEPFEHSTFLYNMPVVLNTAIFMCRPKHPFFKMILWALRETKPTAHPMTTGAFKLTNLYTKYNKITFDNMEKTSVNYSTNTPYFYKGTRQDDDDDSIYIPNSQYFMDTVDPVILITKMNEKIPKFCQHLRPLREKEMQLFSPNIIMRGCFEYYNRREVRKNMKFTFTQHYWNHIWTMDKRWLSSLKRVHIKYIVPNYIIY